MALWMFYCSGKSGKRAFSFFMRDDLPLLNRKIRGVVSRIP